MRGGSTESSFAARMGSDDDDDLAMAAPCRAMVRCCFAAAADALEAVHVAVARSSPCWRWR